MNFYHFVLFWKIIFTFSIAATVECTLTTRSSFHKTNVSVRFAQKACYMIIKTHFGYAGETYEWNNVAIECVFRYSSIRFDSYLDSGREGCYAQKTLEEKVVTLKT